MFPPLLSLTTSLAGGGWYNKDEPLQPLYPGGPYGGDSGYNPGGGGGDYQPLVPGGK